MAEALIMLGLGSALLGGVIGWHAHGLTRNLANRQLRYDNQELEDRNSVLQERVDRALTGERNALARLTIEETTKAEWAKRLLAMRTERDTATRRMEYER